MFTIIKAIHIVYLIYITIDIVYNKYIFVKYISSNLSAWMIPAGVAHVNIIGQAVPRGQFRECINP